MAALGYLALLPAGPVGLRALLKPVPVVCLFAWAWPAARGAAGRLVAAGLVVSAAGDVLLELPGLFLPGLGVFLTAHLCYTAGFLLEARAIRALRAIPFAVWGAAMYALVLPGLGPMKAPVAAYVLVICTMMWRASARVGASGAPRRDEWWGLAGAVLFGASDTLIALHRFLGAGPDRPYLVMLLYWAGQGALAFSARRAAGIPARFGYHHAGPPAA